MSLDTLTLSPPTYPVITDELERSASLAGIRLEVIDGLPIWEASPLYVHQKRVDQIRASLKPSKAEKSGCGCISVADLSILFPDGSLKRPDISIFCSEPPENEEACRLIPEAVIEVISKNYEKKDMEVSLPFYLRHAIVDIVMFDPSKGTGLHYQNGSGTTFSSPTQLTFVCGYTANF